MKYGLFSDIHGNLEAFQAVLEALKKENVDAYVFIGDIVGYGANPRECIYLLKDLIKKYKCICVAGNHDYAACGLSEAKDFNPYAKEAVEWTKGQLDRSDMKFLAQLKLAIQLDGTRARNLSRSRPARQKDTDKMKIKKPSISLAGFTIVHATLEDPKDWGYIFDIDDAYPNFNLLQTQICFIGHSHRPVIFTADEMVDWFFAHKVFLQKEIKYIINIGSVGQPRDGNPKACYAVYDSATGLFEVKRVNYDVHAAQDKIVQAGLPEILAERLSVGR